MASRKLAGGATRQSGSEFYLEKIEHHLYKGDTALHAAAAAYDVPTASLLMANGADARAANRRGQEPLHYAALGTLGSARWNPSLQVAMIRLLVDAGADVNTMDRGGAAPLHRAVRARCAKAVRVLIELGADPQMPNRSGSTPIALATLATGRGGSGSPKAKAEQQALLQLLRSYTSR